MEGKNYRDDLAAKLQEIRKSDEDRPDLSRAEARGYLNAKQETKDYQVEEKEHKKQIINEQLLKHGQPEVPQDSSENIEASKLEWGPDLGEVSVYDIKGKVEELNAGLMKGEKTWRLPSLDELIHEYKRTGSTPVGFLADYYWSGTSHPNMKGNFYIFDMGEQPGYDYSGPNGNDHRVRCVR